MKRITVKDLRKELEGVPDNAKVIVHIIAQVNDEQWPVTSLQVSSDVKHKKCLYVEVDMLQLPEKLY